MVSRQQFEEWFRVSGYNKEGDDDFLWSELSEQYIEGWVECAWQSWQESRAVIVIELPKIIRDNYETSAERNRAYEMRMMIGNILKANGIRTK